MSQLERLAPLAGALFFVLAIAGTIIIGDTPDFVGDPDEIAAFYVENDGSVLAGNVMYLLGGAALLWFLGALRSAFVAAEGGRGRVAATAFGGGVAGTALLLAAASVNAVAALRVAEHDTIDPVLATAMYDLGSVFYGLAAPVAIAVLLIASAVLAFRNAALPGWLGAVSALLGVVCLIAPIAWAGIIAFTFWPLVVGILLYIRAGASPGAAGAAAGA